MATYTELYQRMFADGSLHQKVTAAVSISANTIMNESGGTANHANRLIWAAKALNDPRIEARRMLPAVLAANAGASAAQIDSATDATLQTAVDGAVNLFATGS
jgi:hypothetical protein